MSSKGSNLLFEEQILLGIYWKQNKPNQALSKAECEIIEAAIEDIIFEYTKIEDPNDKE